MTRDGRAPSLTALLLAVLAAVLLWSAFWLPFLHAEFGLALPPWVPDTIARRMRNWLIEAGRIPTGDQYLWSMIRKLLVDGEVLIGLALLVFSAIFPAVKIVLAATLATRRMLAADRQAVLQRALAAVGKWSMADVFVVALVVVLFKAEGFHFHIEAGAGLYCYAASAVLSAAAVALLGDERRVFA